MSKSPLFADIASLPEDDRITIIGRAAESGQRVAFVVEDDAKADRYILKLTARHNVLVVKRMPGPTPNTVSVVITRHPDDEGSVH